MKVKKISNYDRLDKDELHNGDLFEVSWKTEDAYSTRSIEYGILKSEITEDTIETFKQNLNIPDQLSNFNTQIIDPISSIISGDTTFYGLKSFIKRPKIIENVELSNIEDNDLITRKDVGRIIDTRSSFLISQTSKLNTTPLNSSGYTHNDDNLLISHIEDGQRKSNIITCDYDGILVLYGWVACNNDVNAEECWVGIFSEIVNGDNQFHETALAVQPFIIGKYSQVAQYVGFNIPVKSGLKLRVCTGFNVNGQNSGFGNTNSLMLNGNGNEPNTFVGYVIH